MASLQKNVASQNITFALVNAATGLGLASATMTGFVCKDGGSQAAVAGTFTSLGNGQYLYQPTQAETNATDVGFFFACTSTNAVPINMDFHTDQVDANGFLKVDIVDIAGSTVATGSAQLGVNVVNIGAQAVTLDANNLLEVDVQDWAGHAVSAPATAGIPDVNVKNYNNSSAVTDASGFPKVDLEDIGGSALGSHATGMVPADLRDILGSAVNTTSGQIGVNIVTISGSAVNTSSAQLGVNAVDIAGQAAALDGNNLLKVDVEDINGNATAAQALNNSTNAICWGTCSSGTLTTAVASAINNPSSLTDAGQLIGRTIIFLGSTPTGNVQAQASSINGSTTGSTPTIQFVAMTHAPAASDKFVIV